MTELEVRCEYTENPVAQQRLMSCQFQLFQFSLRKENYLPLYHVCYQCGGSLCLPVNWYYADRKGVGHNVVSTYSNTYLLD
jgi:hypothetical protein